MWNQIKNEHVRGSVNVAPVTKNITEKRLKWYGHVKRRDKGHKLGRMLDASVPGKTRRRRRGGQKTRWKDSFKRDIWKVWDYRRRTHWTGQSGRNVLNIILVTSDDGNRALGEDVEEDVGSIAYIQLGLLIVILSKYENCVMNEYMEMCMCA